MSYTPPEENIQDAKQKLLEAIDDFQAVAAARIRGNWSEGHKRELHQLRLMLQAAEMVIVEL